MGITLLVNKALQWEADSTLPCFLLVILVFTIAPSVVLKRRLVFTRRKAGCALQRRYVSDTLVQV